MVIAETDPTRLLTRKEAASYLGLKVSTLAAWAYLKRYRLPYIRCGRLIKYRRSDLDRWLESRTVAAGRRR